MAGEGVRRRLWIFKSILFSFSVARTNWYRLVVSKNSFETIQEIDKLNRFKFAWT